MFNWICIIALATAFFIIGPTEQREMGSRSNAHSSVSDSYQPSNWEIDNPLMILIAPTIWTANNDNQISTEKSCSPDVEIKR